MDKVTTRRGNLEELLEQIIKDWSRSVIFDNLGWFILLIRDKKGVARIFLIKNFKFEDIEFDVAIVVITYKAGS